MDDQVTVHGSFNNDSLLNNQITVSTSRQLELCNNKPLHIFMVLHKYRNFCDGYKDLYPLIVNIIDIMVISFNNYTTKNHKITKFEDLLTEFRKFVIFVILLI